MRTGERRDFCPVDTTILLLILGTLLAMCAGKRTLALALFVISLVATLLLFGSHVTTSLPLNF
jgi:hypothetical protein